MANNLLMLIKLDTDTIARLSLVVSIVAVIVSLVSALSDSASSGFPPWSRALVSCSVARS